MQNRTFLPLLVLSGIWLWSSAALAKDDVLAKAREAAAHSEWDQAVQLAQQVTAQDAGNEDAWAFLGDAQLAVGDTAAGVTAYEKAVKLEPKQPAAVLALTAYYLKQHREPDAERIVAAAEERDAKGKIDEIKVARGMIFAQQGNMAEATKILASAAAKNPKNPLYPVILARIYDDRKVVDLAEKYYADAWKLDPGSATIAYEYGLVLQQQKKYEQALDLFKQVQSKDPKNKTVDYLIGRLYFAARQYENAFGQFERATEKRPDHFLSWYLLGKSYFEYSKAEKKNRYADAERALRKAHELRPERTDVTSALADVLFTRSRLYYQLALADSGGNQKALLDSSILFGLQAMSTDTAIQGVYSQIARDFNKQGNLDSAAYYSKLQVLQTPNDDIEFARYINTLQRKKDQAGLVDALQPAFDKLDWTTKKLSTDTAATAQSKFADKYAGVLAYALMESGKSAQARDVLKQLLSYNPDWCDGYMLQASIDLKRQNWAGAIGPLEAGVRSCPKNADLWNSLGDCYYFANKKPTKKDVDRAKEAYQRARALGSKEAANKLSQLGE
jgi:cytochrome c-type biogenesis protein CcmH/NrfG